MFAQVANPFAIESFSSVLIPEFPDSLVEKSKGWIIFKVIIGIIFIVALGWFIYLFGKWWIKRKKELAENNVTPEGKNEENR